MQSWAPELSPVISGQRTRDRRRYGPDSVSGNTQSTSPLNCLVFLCLVYFYVSLCILCLRSPMESGFIVGVQSFRRRSTVWCIFHVRCVGGTPLARGRGDARGNGAAWASSQLGVISNAKIAV